MSSTNKPLNLQYVSDAIGEDYQQWIEGDYILINSQTGTGKSYFITHTLNDYAKANGKTILYICNRKLLKQQIKRDLIVHEGYSLPSNKDIDQIRDIGCVSVMSYQGITRQIYNSKYKIETKAKQYLNYDFWDGGSMFAEFQYDEPFEYDYVVYDECHYITQDASFNNMTDIFLYDYMQKHNKNVISIFISATLDTVQESIESVIGEDNIHKMIKYTTGNDYSYLNVYHLSNNMNDLINYINNDESEEKWIVFVDSATKGVELLDNIKDSRFICSDKSQYVNKMCLDTRQNIIEHSFFECKCLIATKAMDNGVNIKDPMVKNIAILVLDKTDFIQMLGRKRIDIISPERVNLYIQKRSSKTFQSILNTKINPMQEQIDQYDSMSKHEFSHEYDRNHQRLSHHMFYNEHIISDDNTGKLFQKITEYTHKEWKINNLAHIAHINQKAFCEHMLYRFDEEGKNAFLFEQLYWINQEYDYSMLIEDVISNSEVNSLDNYLNGLVGKKLFADDQKELTKRIMNDYLTIGNDIDYRTSKVKHGTLEKILRDDLNLNYAIESKREGSIKSENYRKTYLLISKLLGE